MFVLVPLDMLRITLGLPREERSIHFVDLCSKYEKVFLPSVIFFHATEATDEFYGYYIETNAVVQISLGDIME